MEDSLENNPRGYRYLGRHPLEDSSADIPWMAPPRGQPGEHKRHPRGVLQGCPL
jgi:hypothetical protein